MIFLYYRIHCQRNGAPMKKLDRLEILTISALYIVLLIILWTSLLSGADILDLQLQVVFGAGFSFYHFIMSTACLFLLWNGMRFGSVNDVAEGATQRMFRILALFVFELQILLLTIDFGIETINLQFAVSLLSSWIFGTFAISSIINMIMGMKKVKKQ